MTETKKFTEEELKQITALRDENQVKVGEFGQIDFSFIGLGEDPSEVVVDGSSNGSVFYFSVYDYDYLASNSISNMTIQNGMAQSGGGIWVNGGDLYFMSEEAVGAEWKCRSKWIWRHAAGAPKYLKMKGE